jgi:hypothetical protein
VIGPSWVLVTDDTNGQNRSAVAAVRALAAAGYQCAVSVSGSRSVAAASRYCRHRVVVPVAGSPSYADAVRRELAARPYLTVLPASDAAVVALEPAGADLVNKSKLAQRAAAAGFPVLETRTCSGADEVRAAATELGYPVVVKPVLKPSAESPPCLVASAPADLDHAMLDVPVVVQPYDSSGLRAVAGVIRGGRLLASVHQRYVRIWPRDCGVGSAAVTVPPDHELEQRLRTLLAGFDGIFQAQLAGSHLLDVNPRVYGSLPLAVRAGVNLPAIQCDALRGVERPLARGGVGVHYRWLEGDLRHLALGVRTRDTSVPGALRSLVPRRGTAHSLESVSDPAPLLVRMAFAARRGG